jgi:hypothetical protein
MTTVTHTEVPPVTTDSRSFLAVTVGGVIIATLSAALGLLAAS